nr:hypothetical protein [Tanacetum cinerariifolium]
SVPSGCTGIFRSVPAALSTSVPAALSRSVLAALFRSVPAALSRSVPAALSRSVLAALFRSVPQDYNASSAVACLFIHSIYVIPCLYIRPLSVMLSRISFHVLYGRYLKFSAKGTKQEVFGMPILGYLITADIQGEPYYQEHLEKVAKHQRYLADETGSDPDSPAPKPAKATKKSKPSVPKVDLRPPVTKLASSQQPEPKPAPAKSQGKKRKLVTKISDKPSPARKSRPGFVTKRHKPTSSLRSVDEYVAEGIPEKEPRFANEEANVQMGLEESLKKVQGKGKEKVTDEQVALDLLTLQAPKKKSPTDQFIFQRHTSIPTGSSGHDESSSLYAKLGLTDSEVEFDKDVPGMDAGVEDEGQAGPNPREKDKGQARPNPDVSTQPHPEKIDEGFTATVYPKVHENLKLMVKEHMILEEPASSTGTFSSLQHLVKDLSFGDIFFNDKPSESDNEKTTAETEAESMVDLLEADIKEILHQRMWETNSYKTHEDHMMLYEALNKSMNSYDTEELLKDLAEARKRRKRDVIHQKHHLGLHLISHLLFHHQRVHLELQDLLELLDHHKCRHHLLHLHPPTKKVNLRQDWSKSLEEARPATLKPAWSIPSSDLPVLKNNWASALASTYLPPSEDSLLVQTSDMPMFMDWFCKRQGITKLKPQDLEGPAFELVKVFHPNVIHLQYQMEEFHKLLTGSVDDSSSGIMLANHYYWVVHPMWIEEECKYYIVAMYGISHWWFQRQRFYIDRHTSEGDHRAVRTHIWILSIVRIKVFSMYGYDYMNKIVLRRADLNEHIIAERDFKYLYPSDFDDLYLLNLQGHLNHLPPKDKKILTTAINLWTRHLVIKQRVEDFQLEIESYQTQLNLTNHNGMPRALNTSTTIHDGTLHQIDETLDYRVKEFKVNKMNPGLNTRFWIKKDVHRSKEIMFPIQKRLKTRRIFRNLESFVGGRVKDGDYRLIKRTE